MERASEAITIRTLQRAYEAVAARKELEIADTRVPGLVLRVRGKKVSFALRGRLKTDGQSLQSTWKICDADPRMKVDLVRARATEARNLLAQGINPAPFLAESVGIAGAPIGTSKTTPSRDGWTWSEAVDRYLGHVLQQKSPKTAQAYRSILTCPAIRESGLPDRLLADLTADDVRAIREVLEEQGKLTMANRVVSHASMMWRWCADRRGSGVTDQASPFSTVTQLIVRIPDGRIPTPEEIGTIPWMLTGRHQAARLGVMLMILTGQRRETLRTARVEDLVPDEAPYGPRGWGLWAMKRDPQLIIDRPHTVTLPPLAWSIVEALKQMSGGSEWLFPQLRRRRADDKGGKSMSGNVFRNALKEASPAGEDASPHDYRRAFATLGSEYLHLADRAIGFLLNHSEGRGGITRKRYNRSQDLPLKRESMKKWQDWVVQLMLHNRPVGRPFWPEFLPKPDHMTIENEAWLRRMSDGSPIGFNMSEEERALVATSTPIGSRIQVPDDWKPPATEVDDPLLR